MSEVTLSQILKAREMRVSRQQSMIEANKCPLVSFTMNIAGPVKNSLLIERSFKEGLSALDKRIPKECILARYIDISDTGCEAFLSVRIDAEKLKEICVSIEEDSPIGRLFDMDVLSADNKKLERKALRGCIVCGAPGRICAAGRIHSVSELQATTRNIMENYFSASDRKRFSDLAVKSLLCEVYTTPKPGLVDKRNSGSHKDMDVGTFERSAASLTPYFSECVAIGQKTADRPPAETFSLLRSAGINAEKVMCEVTGGVNTHKGAIYSMGIICGALGRLWTAESPIADTDAIFSMCSQLTKDAVKSDFASENGSTAGGRLYLEYGLTGIRGEVSAGFPSVKRFSLPAFQKALDDEASSNDAGVAALLHLIANVEDTNLYHRGGCDGVHYARDCAKSLLEKPCKALLKQVEKLDDDFIAKNLSPGGCADLLAVTYFIHKLQKKNEL